jgi:hypothetical protein
MSDKKDNALRIGLANLPPREEQTNDRKIDQILKRIAGQEGSPCKRTCDCAFGLVCLDGVCTPEW